VSDYARVADLELEIDGYKSERRTLEISSQFTRVTTTVVLTGGGVEGRGEDVTYEPDAHDRFPTDLQLGGRQTFDEFSERLAALELPGYTPWAFESAALDLALRQADASLGDVVGREYRPVRFVVSTREDVRPWRELYPGLEFKVDPEVTWTRELMEELATLGAIRVADLKGYYRNTPVDVPADPRLYRDVVDVFDDAVIEDAFFTDETRPILAEAAERLSFDAPIHSVDDVLELEIEPRLLNIKPSRIGTVRRLFDLLAFGEQRRIRMYGGGQFELGVGRDQIQAIASLYYADAANDVAPREYNVPPPRPGLRSSPLDPPARPRGLAFTD
jgi:hypothetical protein